MSVLKNKRSESQLEFYHTATLIRTELTRFVMNEKIVPKRWRPVFTFPMVDKVIKLFDYITAANTIYPQNLREAERRRDYQTQAIIVVEHHLVNRPGQVSARDRAACQRGGFASRMEKGRQ